MPTVMANWPEREVSKMVRAHEELKQYTIPFLGPAQSLKVVAQLERCEVWEIQARKQSSVLHTTINPKQIEVGNDWNFG
jgi:hypothetical protein